MIPNAFPPQHNSSNSRDLELTFLRDLSGTKKEHKPKLLSPDIFRWGRVGVFHVKGWGPKTSVCPSKLGKSNFFGGISAGISRGRPKN